MYDKNVVQANDIIDANILCFCSPNKSDFIRAKYQFLSFVNKQKDSDASSLDDVSKVGSLFYVVCVCVCVCVCVRVCVCVCVRVCECMCV